MTVKTKVEHISYGILVLVTTPQRNRELRFCEAPHQTSVTHEYKGHVQGHNLGSVEGFHSLSAKC